jgi:hypothetical protein
MGPSVSLALRVYDPHPAVTLMGLPGWWTFGAVLHSAGGRGVGRIRGIADTSVTLPELTAVEVPPQGESVAQAVTAAWRLDRIFVENGNDHGLKGPTEEVYVMRDWIRLPNHVTTGRRSRPT